MEQPSTMYTWCNIYSKHTTDALKEPVYFYILQYIYMLNTEVESNELHLLALL